MKFARKSFFKPFYRSGKYYNSQKEQEFVSRQSWLQIWMYLLNSFWKEFLITIKSMRAGQGRLPQDIQRWTCTPRVHKFSIEPRITWIGHSTFLIQIGKKNILTDPIFGSPSIFFPRILPPGIKPTELPKIDYVLISHNHFDHMDENSLLFLKQVNPDLAVLIPEGNQYWFEKRGFKKIYFSTWWEKTELGSLSFTFLPAYHWSQRSLFDINRSLWGSWMIQHQGLTIYFAGDTAYSHHFKAIGKEFDKIDVAIMPIGPCEPRKYMLETHVNAEEAGEAFLDLNAKFFIPMHWGTFHFGTDGFTTATKRILKWWKKNRTLLKGKLIYIPKFGESIAPQSLQLQRQRFKEFELV